MKLLEHKLDTTTVNLKFLNEDQKRALQSPSSTSNRGITWSVKTICEAFQIRFVTGMHGYEFVRRLGYPLPAYRTLCERVHNAEFRPGVQHDVVNWLTVKMTGMLEKECDVI